MEIEIIFDILYLVLGLISVAMIIYFVFTRFEEEKKEKFEKRKW